MQLTRKQVEAAIQKETASLLAWHGGTFETEREKLAMIAGVDAAYRIIRSLGLLAEADHAELQTTMQVGAAADRTHRETCKRMGIAY
jgi:hypothetical protein